MLSASERISHSTWLKWLIVTFTLLGWIVIGGVVLWVIGQLIGTIVLLVIAALLASIIFPLVRLLARFIPRFLAITLVYIVLLGGLLLLLYLVALLFFHQTTLLIQQIQAFFSSGRSKGLHDTLASLGISSQQWGQLRQQILAPFQQGVSSLLPFLNSLMGIFVSVLLITTLSVYFLLEKERMSFWIQHGTPRSQRLWISFLLTIFRKTISNSLRGQIMVVVIMGVLTGAIVALFGVPYGVFVAVLTVFLQFIPVIGSILIIAMCGLLAFLQGVPGAIPLVVLITLLQVVQQVLTITVSPRALGKVAGLHPIVAIVALLIGNRFFGFWGTFFALPIASFLQAILIAFWTTWKAAHPEEFVGQFQQSNTAESPEQAVNQPPI